MTLLEFIKVVVSKFVRLDIKWRIAFLLVAAFFITSATAVFFYNRLFSLAGRNNLERGKIILMRLVEEGEDILLGNGSLRDYDSILSENGVLSASVVDADRRVVFPLNDFGRQIDVNVDLLKGTEAEQTGNIYTLTAPIYGSLGLNEPIGFAVLRFNSGDFGKGFFSTESFLLIMTSIAAASVLVVSFAVARWIERPIDEMCASILSGTEKSFHNFSALSRLRQLMMVKAEGASTRSFLPVKELTSLWLDISEVVEEGMLLFGGAHRLLEVNKSGAMWLGAPADSNRGLHLIDVLKELPMGSLLSDLLGSVERDRRTLAVGECVLSYGVKKMAVLKLNSEEREPFYGIIIPPFSSV